MPGLNRLRRHARSFARVHAGRDYILRAAPREDWSLGQTMANLSQADSDLRLESQPHMNPNESTERLCDVCGQRPAIVEAILSGGGTPRSAALCERCAGQAIAAQGGAAEPGAARAGTRQR